jgi:hypothetical protein
MQKYGDRVVTGVNGFAVHGRKFRSGHAQAISNNLSLQFIIFELEFNMNSRNLTNRVELQRFERRVPG